MFGYHWFKNFYSPTALLVTQPANSVKALKEQRKKYLYRKYFFLQWFDTVCWFSDRIGIRATKSYSEKVTKFTIVSYKLTLNTTDLDAYLSILLLENGLITRRHQWHFSLKKNPKYLHMMYIILHVTLT